MMLLKRLYMIALKSYAIDTSRFVKKKKTDYDSRSIEIKVTCLVLLT